MKNENVNINAENYWYKFYDGWFSYYVNNETGQKKFELEEGDILIQAPNRFRYGISRGDGKARIIDNGR